MLRDRIPTAAWAGWRGCYGHAAGLHRARMSRLCDSVKAARADSFTSPWRGEVGPRKRAGRG